MHTEKQRKREQRCQKGSVWPEARWAGAYIPIDFSVWIFDFFQGSLWSLPFGIGNLMTLLSF